MRVFPYASMVSNKYKVIDMIGWGAYGQVYEVMDTTKNIKRALKVCSLHTEEFQRNARAEAEMTEYLSREDSENRVVRYVEHFQENRKECLVLHLEHFTLHNYVEQFYPLGLKPTDLRPLFKSLLRGLQYLEQKEILHNDIRGDNILVNAKGECVIADFGLSTSVPRTQKMVYHRFPKVRHRAPEIILLCPSIGYGTDMWSVAILLVQYTTTIMFEGVDGKYTMKKYLGLFGNPPAEFLDSCMCVSNFFEKVDGIYRLIPDDGHMLHEDLLVTHIVTRARQLHEKQIIVQAELDDTIALHKLLERMLKWDPAERATPEEALNEQFFTSSVPDYKSYEGIDVH